MKTQISRWSDDPAKRRSGIYQQQGRMISDADLNELVELLKRRVDDALADVVGSGTPREGGVGLVSAGPLLRPGALYADGVRARLAPATPGAATFALNAQADFPSPPAWPATGEQILYADVWELTTTALQDAGQLDPGLHGADTSTRTQMLAQVKWCPSATDPLTAPQNPRKGDATLQAEFREGQAEADPCDPCAAEIALDARVGNYLFRLEVHDVQGPANAPTEVTLKWSSENGAEQHAQADVPAEFKRGDWIYEFYNDTTERHLGVQLATGFAPQRAVLKDGWPAAADLPAAGAYPYVRRWDGRAVLARGAAWSVKSVSSTLQAKDRGRVFTPLPGGGTPTHGHFTVGTALVAYLSGLKLTLALDTKKFVAGDFWLATVREDAEGPARVQQTQATPIGIEHHYVALARANGAAVVPFSDVDTRRLSFPRLTDLTADRVGYDPASTSARWTDIIDDALVAAPLNVQRAIDLLVEKLESTDVSYLVPTCTASPSVRSLFGAALTALVTAQGRIKLDQLLTLFLCNFNAATVPLTNNCTRLYGPTANTVQQALDELCNIEGSDIAYTIPNCPPSPATAPATVQSLLRAASASIWDPNSDGRSTVADVLNALLCQLKADHIPFTHTCGSGLYPGTMAPTVAAALNALCNIRAEHVAYTGGTFPNVKVALDALLAIATNVATPPGTVVALATDVVPAGWLECNGFQVKRATYGALFAAIGTRFGAGDGASTFNVPDLRGEFIRGWDNGRNVDSGRVMGSAQPDSLQDHQHTDAGHSHVAGAFVAPDHTHVAWAPNNSSNDAFSQGWPASGHNAFRTSDRGRDVAVSNVINPGGSHSHALFVNNGSASISIPTTGRHGPETRPRSIALMYCIKH